VARNSASRGSTAATIDCTNPTLVPHPVYIAGAAAVKGYLEAVAGLLGSSVSLIYSSAPLSCGGLGAITAGETVPGAGFSLVTSTTTESCTGAPVDAGVATYGPINIDIGVSDVYASTCITPQIPTLPSGFQDFLGPIQPFEITVPWGSSQFSISAEAAYVVFGFGGQTYTVPPWNVSTDIWTRGDTAGVQLIIATAIGLSADKWLSTLGDAGGAQIVSSASMPGDITSSGASGPDPVIGILGSASVDPDKVVGGLKPLAFQATGQDCAYYADSTLSAYDKVNVRQGRYAIWGPEHFVAAVSAPNSPIASGTSNPVPSADADVQTVIDIITHSGLQTTTATATLPSLQSVIQAETAAYYVPTCAMQVSRTSEIGPEASYQPEHMCGCYYEAQPHGGAGNLSSYCATCTVATQATDCTDKNYPTCEFGYCEAQ